jgi:hypothetical protein
VPLARTRLGRCFKRAKSNCPREKRSGYIDWRGLFMNGRTVLSSEAATGESLGRESQVLNAQQNRVAKRRQVGRPNHVGRLPPLRGSLSDMVLFSQAIAFRHFVTRTTWVRTKAQCRLLWHSSRPHRLTVPGQPNWARPVHKRLPETFDNHKRTETIDGVQRQAER